MGEKKCPWCNKGLMAETYETKPTIFFFCSKGCGYKAKISKKDLTTDELMDLSLSTMDGKV